MTGAVGEGLRMSRSVEYIFGIGEDFRDGTSCLPLIGSRQENAGRRCHRKKTKADDRGNEGYRIPIEDMRTRIDVKLGPTVGVESEGKHVADSASSIIPRLYIRGKPGAKEELAERERRFSTDFCGVFKTEEQAPRRNCGRTRTSLERQIAVHKQVQGILHYVKVQQAMSFVNTLLECIPVVGNVGVHLLTSGMAKLLAKNIKLSQLSGMFSMTVIRSWNTYIQLGWWPAE